MNRELAEKKARYLIGLLQGTMSLEGQGLPNSFLEELIQKTTEEIMNAPICANCGSVMLETDPENQCNHCDHVN